MVSGEVLNVKPSFILGKPTMLKRFQNPLTGASEAKVVYQDGDYQILRHGTFVRCAVTE